MSESTWDAQTDVNLKSVYLTTHHILPIMQRQSTQSPLPSPGTGGAIINIASIAALRYIGKPQIAYSATKAAVIQFTKATAVMYAPHNIRLNVVVPGLIHTPLVHVLADKYNNGDYEGLVKKRDAGVPLGGKMGVSHDVAYCVCFLASSAARHVTGQKLVVDGGVTVNAAPA